MTDTLAQLDTPALLLDRDRLENNLMVMRFRAGELGVALRPHMKTAKSAEVFDLAAVDRITVSTVAEARYFAARGATDILYAVGVTSGKLTALKGLYEVVSVAVDSPIAAAAAAAAGFRTWIEIDSDGRRGGVAPGSTQLLEIAHVLKHPFGVFTHAGGSYAARTRAELTAWAERERSAVVTAATRLLDEGFDCPNVSVGSTPTACFAQHLHGVTEMRPGVYMFGDTFQAGIGTCRFEDIAISILTTVIGTNGSRALIDAGALALSLDRSIAHDDHGYGVVTDRDGAPIGAVVERVTQEHGVLSDGTHGLKPGDRVRVFPNHACISAACHDHYIVMSREEVIGRWERCRGW